MNHSNNPSREKNRSWMDFLFNENAYSIGMQRACLNTAVRMLAGKPAHARCEPTSIAGVRAETITGWADADGRVLMYLHGGGYVMGSVDTHRPLAAALARRTSALGIVVDYRLAPEHPFPAALEDAMSVYRALLEERRCDPARIILAGDSAGGGLCLALLLALRDQGIPLPAAAFLMSPWTDLVNCDKSTRFERNGRRNIVDYTCRYLADMYAKGQDRKNPLISPALGNYAGLPPLLIQAGRYEPLRQDAAMVAKQAEQHGVDVTLTYYNSAIHVIQALGAFLRGPRTLIKQGAWFLKSHLEPSAGEAPEQGNRRRMQ